ncbi:meiosis-specific nuclear structural protein 1 [Plutella xylostella]|uniref:meiosis-specific nuclear structural protein 1 n=1 Tax=Plutella xylostella TaxID=51655 RepID=UPI002033092A|nr:meiosis-specific nuclear structural protein 1 [Plutella xylostella]
MENKSELQQNDDVKNRSKELSAYQRAQDLQWINNRMERSGMSRCLALIHKEAAMEKAFQEQTDHAALVNEKAKKEIALGIEVDKVHRQEVSELLRRHYLREKDPELRELIGQLQRGYLCRDQKQQILHNQYRKLQDKAEEMRANQLLTNALFDNDKEAHQQEKDLMASKAAYCKELQQQLVNRQKQKQCQYEETLIEKKMLDDVIQTIHDEDARELQKKRESTEKLKREMETFKLAQAAWRERQRAAVAAEERRIEEQAKQLGDRKTTDLADKERRFKVKEDNNYRMAAKTQAEEDERKKREDIIKQLQEQEYLEKTINDQKAEREKEERTKREMKTALSLQMENRRIEETEQRIRDENYRKAIEARQNSDNEKERQRELERKEKMRLYAIDLKEQIEQREMEKKKNKQDDNARSKYVAEFNNSWDNEVRKEREKLVSEHVPHLLGYLQAGVIKKEDIPAVKEGASKHEHLAKLDLGSLDTRSKDKRFPKCNVQCRRIRDY